MKKVYFTQINNVIAEATFLPLSVAYVWEYCNANVEGWELGGILFERETVAEYLKQITAKLSCVRIHTHTELYCLVYC